MPIEDTFVYKLTEQGIDEIPARKAAQVLKYYKEVYDKDIFPPTQRIPMIWKGMIKLGIQPYINENAKDTKVPLSLKLNDLDSIATGRDLSQEQLKIYHDLDSIAIGIAVCIRKKLLATCEHTKYSITAKGVEFTETDSKNK